MQRGKSCGECASRRPGMQGTELSVGRNRDPSPEPPSHEAGGRGRIRRGQSGLRRRQPHLAGDLRLVDRGARR